MIYVMLKKMHFLFPKIFNTAVPPVKLNIEEVFR